MFKGEIAALLTAACWTVTVLSFESAGKKIGSLAVNLIRLILAFLFLSIFLYLTRGMPFPSDATVRTWFWLAVSGLIGFTLGDLLLFEAFVRIGARISMLIMALVPVTTTLISWFLLQEMPSLKQLAGMAVTICGITLVLLHKKKDKKRSSYSIWGIVLALGGTIGQATGLVLSKYGMGDYNPFAATQIRILAGTVGFSIMFVFWRKWNRVWSGLKNKKAMQRITIGAFFGPFLGVSLSLYAIQHTYTAIASTLMALTPVFVLAPAAIFFKERIGPIDIMGAIIAIVGVALIFI